MLPTIKSALQGCVVLSALLGLTGAHPASAAGIPYSNVTTENPDSYTFTAAATGPLDAYFYGTGADFNERLGLLVNGVDTSIVGLQNHTSVVGEKLSFGNVTAGDVLTFYIIVDSLSGQKYYSDPSRNPDGHQQIYSALYAGSAAIPAGTYVGFEDLNPVISSYSDYNYTDEQFVFTNTTLVQTVPLPAAAPLFGIGLVALGMTGYCSRRRSRNA